MRAFLRGVMMLLREIADENAYERHLQAHGRVHSARGVAAVFRRAAGAKVRAREVLLKVIKRVLAPAMSGGDA